MLELKLINVSKRGPCHLIEPQKSSQESRIKQLYAKEKIPQSFQHNMKHYQQPSAWIISSSQQSLIMQQNQLNAVYPIKY